MTLYPGNPRNLAKNFPNTKVSGQKFHRNQKISCVLIPGNLRIKNGRDGRKGEREGIPTYNSNKKKYLINLMC